MPKFGPISKIFINLLNNIQIERGPFYKKLPTPVFEPHISNKLGCLPIGSECFNFEISQQFTLPKKGRVYTMEKNYISCI